MTDFIEIRNAHTHNLKGINLDIPRNKLVVFSGVSGSGKSSLVFDTIYTEAQRQLIETFSSFARRRLPKLSRPDVDEIKNLGTGIIIDQKRLGKTLRSTVGTATEIYTHLRLLFSRCAKPFIGGSYLFSFNHPEGMCPACIGLGRRIQIDKDMFYDPKLTLKEGAILHPDYKKGGFYWRDYTTNGLFDPDKKLAEFSKSELNTLLYAEGEEITRTVHGVEYTKNWVGLITRMERYFLNKAEDEKAEDEKNAYQQFLKYTDCDVCKGTRLNEKALCVKLLDKNIAELSGMELTELDIFLSQINDQIAQPLVLKMRHMLGHLITLGAGYLSLSRSVATLSGGESQRIKMARQLDCDLTGLMYVLDEPSVGLHPRDTEKLLQLLIQLRNRGNSVLVVEHDPDIITAADYIIDIGPKAGTGGGEVCFSGTVAELKKSSSATGSMLKILSSEKYSGRRRKPSSWFEIKNASIHNLKNISVKIPKHVLCCITGVAGSGKSSLIHDVFAQENQSVIIDQSAVGKNSRSNLLTYTGIFDSVRKIFSSATGKPTSLFSFNSEGGCPECKGQGTIAFEMNFMDDITVQCNSCQGRRYTEEVLALSVREKSIFDILSMTVEDAQVFFQDKKILKQLALLSRVGLGYLELGQSLSTFSGGEAQRLKLAGELSKEGTIYIMDEPTTGLHLSDIKRLMKIVFELIDQGNSVIIIEHNMEVIKQADWIIDMGPEGGDAGGEIIAEGPPETIAACKKSITGKYL